MSSALFLFLFLTLVAAGLLIAGVYILGGLGAALLTCGACSAFAAWFLHKGMSIE